MRKLGLIALMAVATSILLSGCLVSKKDPVYITRSTDNLRIYQPDDFILYDVLEQRITDTGTQFTNGTLRIDWLQTADLRDPNDNGQTPIPVLQELVTLTFDGDGESGTVRYIAQDSDSSSPSYGTVRLHAFEAPGISKQYWLNTNGNTTNTSVEPFTVFPSPLGVTGLQPPVSFFVMEGCENILGNCEAEIGQFSDRLDIVGDTKQVTTNLGIFTNPFEIEFSGTTLPGGGLTTLPVLFDIRGACGDNQPGITTFNGTMFVAPEIGVIQMFVNCIGGDGSQVIYNITFNTTNISLP